MITVLCFACKCYCKCCIIL